jgi:hypothetical protein
MCAWSGRRDLREEIFRKELSLHETLVGRGDQGAKDAKTAGALAMIESAIDDK